MKIKRIKAREILDSRGFPTIESKLEFEGGGYVVASVPSGASVGKYEAIELRDGDKNRFMGKGVLKAIENIENVISPALAGSVPDIVTMDILMCALDGSDQKSVLGANAILACSLAIARAQAMVERVKLFELLNNVFDIEGFALPYCMFNILNGGGHADNGISFQEFMIVPVNKPTVAESLHIAVCVYQSLKNVLKQRGYATTVGDEGGFAPILKLNSSGSAREVLDLLMLAVDAAGYTHDDVVFALDVAASQFYDEVKGLYSVDGQSMDRAGLVQVYADLCRNYPIFSIEDGMAEDDWDGWQLLTKSLGNDIQLVGDDLLVTNSNRIQKAIDMKVTNAVLIKPNQIGTVSEAVNAIIMSKEAGYKTVVSHRSGETSDSFIADFVVATAAGQFKSGAPARGERVAKYNRLLEIEAFLVR